MNIISGLRSRALGIFIGVAIAFLATACQTVWERAAENKREAERAEQRNDYAEAARIYHNMANEPTAREKFGSAATYSTFEGSALVKDKRYEEADAAFARAESITKSQNSISDDPDKCPYFYVQVSAAEAYRDVDAKRAAKWATKALGTCVEALTGSKGALPEWPYTSPHIGGGHASYQFSGFFGLAFVFDTLGMSREAYQAGEWYLALNLHNIRNFGNRDIVKQAERAQALGFAESAAAWRKEALAHAQLEKDGKESSANVSFSTREKAVQTSKSERLLAKRYQQLNAPRLASSRLAVALHAEAEAGITPTAQERREQQAHLQEMENMIDAHQANERAMFLENVAGVAARPQKGSRASSPQVNASATQSTEKSRSGNCSTSNQSAGDFSAMRTSCERCDHGVFRQLSSTRWVCVTKAGNYIRGCGLGNNGWICTAS